MTHMQQGTNLPKVGSYNQAVVLEAIQASDGISRVQIAAVSGLTAQTVSVIVRRLLEEGLVVEDGSAPSSGGKPRTILRVDAGAGYAVGVHFDPQELSCVLADLAGRPVARLHLPVRPGARPDAVVRQMARAARRILREAGVPDGKVLGVGLACPGPLDGEGVMVSPPRLPGWDQVPIKGLLREYTGFPVTVDNDATAAAIGERWAGIARATPSFAYLYLGTGIGGGLILDNQVYRGRSLNAAEFGHITVEPDGPECYCGNRGCVEAVCCPNAIEAAMGADHASVCAAAAAGEPEALRVIERVAGRLADAAVSVVNMLDIDLLVLGGPALREVGEIYREVITRAVSERALTRRLHAVRVETSPIAADAAAIGAASLVFHATYAPRLGTLLSG
ncbi:Sugar kinase of the NBD/HSP70 family, may contain an N-terminal HTH domain [Nonomuraea solani]|uniref:Sugar kinase of the NBD/HSP70 family, may contain an N-terminal HTH domain n=1 Tax=Nonomuraea solani TaxID=1144553 RepID=A0A1H6DYU2_9ACTN|nr:ROK family transcriptional regulator [Nonomuraea solani]SEG90522.1 Sugar kinase of the NBD/HSP70 family, may contain an N-terminal HTH domain [Nonomuraea solani]